MAREFAKKFYKSKVWQNVRQSYIKSVKGLCEVCKTNGEITLGYILHHKIELTEDNINDPYITLSWDNLQFVCMECHNKIHFEQTKPLRDGLMFDKDGNVVPL